MTDASAAVLLWTAVPRTLPTHRPAAARPRPRRAYARACGERGPCAGISGRPFACTTSGSTGCAVPGPPAGTTTESDGKDPMRMANPAPAASTGGLASHRAPPGQRPARGALRGPPHAGRRRLPLVRRRLPPRGQGPHRPRPPLRAPDVPGLRATSAATGTSSCVQGAGGSLNGTTSFERTNYFETDARPPAGTRALAGGRPDGLAARRRSTRRAWTTSATW